MSRFYLENFVQVKAAFLSNQFGKYLNKMEISLLHRLAHMAASLAPLSRAAGALLAPFTPALPQHRCPLPRSPRAHPTPLATALKPGYPSALIPPRLPSLSFPEPRVCHPPLSPVKDSTALPPPILPSHAKWSNRTAPTPSTPPAPPSPLEPRDLITFWVFPAGHVWCRHLTIL
jgi:hypothetical protein